MMFQTTSCYASTQITVCELRVVSQLIKTSKVEHISPDITVIVVRLLQIKFIFYNLSDFPGLCSNPVAQLPFSLAF